MKLTDYFGNASAEKTMDEKKLIEDCKKEKRSSQELLYKRYARKMKGVCLRYANDDMDADDILQEGFIKVFNNISEFRMQGSLEGWIRKIMINTALNRIRLSNKKTDYLEDMDMDIPYNEHLLEKLNYKEILSLLKKLPEGYRAVFNLFVVEGYSHQEISEQLGIEVVTSRTQLSKARKHLQKLIYQLEEIRS
jgi:RNA polymerase sigma-70 factor (ECF subfamily)